MKKLKFIRYLLRQFYPELVESYKDIRFDLEIIHEELLDSYEEYGEHIDIYLDTVKVKTEHTTYILEVEVEYADIETTPDDVLVGFVNNCNIYNLIKTKGGDKLCGMI